MPSLDVAGRPAVRWAAVVLALVVGAASLAACGGDEDQDHDGADAWPAVDVIALDGSTASSADVVAVDGPTVVSLWATWCKPCKKELPMLQRLSESGAVDVVGINVGDRPADVAAFLDDLGVTFPTYIDDVGEVESEVGQATLPATFVVDDGRIVWRHAGEVTRADLDHALVELDASSAADRPTSGASAPVVGRDPLLA